MKVIRIKERKDQYYIWETSIFEYGKSCVPHIIVELFNNEPNLSIKSNGFITALLTTTGKILIYTLPTVDEDKFKICFLEALDAIRRDLNNITSNNTTIDYDIPKEYKTNNILRYVVESIVLFFDNIIKYNTILICNNKVEKNLIEKAIDGTFLSSVKVVTFSEHDIDFSTCNYILHNCGCYNILNIGFAYGLDENILNKVVFPKDIFGYGLPVNTRIKQCIDTGNQNITNLGTVTETLPIISPNDTIVDYTGYYIARMASNLNMSSSETYNFICSRIVISPDNYYNIESLTKDKIEILEDEYVDKFKQSIYKSLVQLPMFNEAMFNKN